MKTPEQWIAEYNSTRYTKDRKLIFRDGSLIKAIQEDAREQGMKDAAIDRINAKLKTPNSQ